MQIEVEKHRRTAAAFVLAAAAALVGLMPTGAFAADEAAGPDDMALLKGISFDVRTERRLVPLGYAGKLIYSPDGWGGVGEVPADVSCRINGGEATVLTAQAEADEMHKVAVDTNGDESEAVWQNQAVRWTAGTVGFYDFSHTVPGQPTPEASRYYVSSLQAQLEGLAEVHAAYDESGEIVGLEVTLTNQVKETLLVDELVPVRIDMNGWELKGADGTPAAIDGVPAVVVKNETQKLYFYSSQGIGTLKGGDGYGGDSKGSKAVVLASGAPMTTYTYDANTVSVLDAATRDGTYWAWATGTMACEESAYPAGVSTKDGKIYFFRTNSLGAAKFDFAALSGEWTGGDGVIHFVAGDITVDGLKDTGLGGDLTFVGDPAGTTLRAISEASVFAVSGVAAKRTWKNLKFTDGASAALDKADGGAISMTGGSMTVDGCEFRDCVGGEFGGAIYAAFLSGDSTVTNSTFTGNRPLVGGDGYYGENGLGGAIYASAASEGVTFAVADSVFEDNEAYSGGAIYAKTAANDGENPVALSILRVTFSGNRADGFDGNGGAIVAEGDVTVDTGNVTVDEFAGLVCAGEPTVFTNNTATANGGAIWMTGRQHGDYVPTVKISRGVVFADNRVVDGVDWVLGGAFANWIPCRFEATGVAFRGNTARCVGKSTEYSSLALGGALAFTEDAKSVLVDTCVFDGNDVFVQEGTWRYGGAIGMVNVTSAVLKNSTFRNSTAEALALLGSTVGVTNCVIVGNGAGLGTDGAPLDVWIEQSTVDIAYSAYGNVEDVEAGPLTWLEHGNLANCDPDEVYAGETLRLNENGFNPVAALGIAQDAYDFVGVRYGSKNVELCGSSMGAYETGFTPLVVTLTGDKAYDGHTTSNGCAWTWQLTDTNGVAQTWDELGDVSNAFTIVDWEFGEKDHGYYASTNDAPMDVVAHLAGNENLWFALRFRYDGTISRRNVDLGGMLVETTPDEYAYTGDQIDPTTVKVTDTNANEVLVLGTDYILRYENNVNPTDGARVVVEGINNYEGVVSTNYFITAYYVEYSFDDVVDDSRTEIHGAMSEAEAFAQEISEGVAGYAFDAHHSPTNGLVYRYNRSGVLGAPAQLVLQVQYYTDSNGDGVPDKYQKRIRAKVVNGEWNDEDNGRDKILWVTLYTNGVWSTAGQGKMPEMPAAGANADGGYTGNKDNKWLTLQGGQLVYLTAQQLADHYVTSGSVPFFLYAYLKGTPGSSLGFNFGRPGSGSSSTETPDVAGRFAAYVEASSLTMNPVKKLATISVKATLVEAESGAPVTDIPLEGSTVTVKAMETLGGPSEDLEVPVDGDGNVTVPAEGASGFWQIGL